MKTKKLRQKRRNQLSKSISRKKEVSSMNTSETFVTPLDYKPIHRMVLSGIKMVPRHTDVFTGYLFGLNADSVAARLGLNPNDRVSQGIWTIHKSNWKAARRLGVQLETHVDPDVVAELAKPNEKNS